MKAKDLSDFIIYLRKTCRTNVNPETNLVSQSDINISDTSLVYAIADYLKINFQEANRAVNESLGIS